MISLARTRTGGCWAVGLLVLLSAGAALACGAAGPPPARDEAAAAPTPAPAASLTRRDAGQGGVTVEATWVTREHRRELPQASLASYPAEAYALVHLKMDTHSVDLGGYDLAKRASLRGQSWGPDAAAAWLALEESGHHREGLLVFPGLGNEGWQALGGQVELALSELAGVSERILRWDF